MRGKRGGLLTVVVAIKGCAGDVSYTATLHYQK